MRTNATFDSLKCKYMELVAIEDNQDDEETKDIGLYRTKMWTAVKSHPTPNLVKHFYGFQDSIGGLFDFLVKHRYIGGRPELEYRMADG